MITEFIHYLLITVGQWRSLILMKRKTLQPSKKEYIHNILIQHNQTHNEKFICFCEKLVYDVVVLCEIRS